MPAVIIQVWQQSLYEWNMHRAVTEPHIDISDDCEVGELSLLIFFYPFIHVPSINCYI